jgi:hypothetical protein
LLKTAGELKAAYIAQMQLSPYRGHDQSGRTRRRKSCGHHHDLDVGIVRTRGVGRHSAVQPRSLRPRQSLGRRCSGDTGPKTELIVIDDHSANDSAASPNACWRHRLVPRGADRAPPTVACRCEEHRFSTARRHMCSPSTPTTCCTRPGYVD